MFVIHLNQNKGFGTNVWRVGPVRTWLHTRIIGKFSKKIWFMFVLFLLIAGVSVTSGAMIHVNAMNRDQGTEESAQNPPAETTDIRSLLSIEPGDTLWSVAERYKPEHMTVKQYIRQIVIVNGLQSTRLQAGQVIRLP